ncbi:MAG: DUF4900 domain-containing protein [Candidatus Omnitrophica bacterium]|nr:DUF4900 domain-containing protein [Candidatus Omnitrophota bacterium]
MLFRKPRGIALIIAFLVIVVLLILGSIFILRSVGEKYAGSKEKASIQAFFLAEAGANVGLNKIDLFINTDMLTTVNNTNPNTLVNRLTKNPNYIGNGNGIGFLVDYTKKEGVKQFTLVENGAGNDDDEAVYSVSATALGNGSYDYNVTITEKGNPQEVAEDKWDFPYNYTITATGTVESTPRQVVLKGDFTVRVQRDNFARYALFTDHHRLESGTTVWFTNRTHFYGPTHTNERFSFAWNPSGTFDGLVTQHNNNARFYNNGSAVLLNADSNPPRDVPTFNAGFNRGVDEIVLASSVQKQDLQEQAWGGVPGTVPNGIYVNNNGTSLTGGIYVKGNCTMNMGVDVNGNATYNITRGTTAKIITVDYGDEAVIGDEQTTVQTVGGPTNTYSGVPDGIEDVGTIIYVDGEVSSLAGTVQKNSQVTISSENDIIIQNNILYEEYTPGSGTPGEPGYVPPTAEDKTNLLGMLSWGGDVRIGTSAPDDISIHGTVMARNGVFTVDQYNFGDPRGAATLLGGVITQFYGAFGQFNSVTGQQVHGYGRNFIYDARMAAGQSPPYFPTMRTFIAFTNDITDRITWQEGAI